MAYENEMIAHNGGCHCGRVRFEVKAPRFLEISECNCSICKKSGILHYVVRQEHFNLIKGEEVLTKYTFGTGIAEHPFCSICGIKSFYRPRAYPAGISINANCIDPDQIHGMKVVRQFDGLQKMNVIQSGASIQSLGSSECSRSSANSNTRGDRRSC